MSDRQVAGRYELERRVGRGGMGQVWQATDRILDRVVAVKEVHLAGPDDVRDRARARAIREARAAAGVPHRNVATVFDVIDEDDRVYIVMELVRGETLAERVGRDGPLSPDAAARVGVAMAEALQMAHDRGVVHRDVKPSNVMLAPDGAVKLTDFGVASLRDDASLTLTGQVMGSPLYMAPEQAQGQPARPETDLWGLGVTLYFAVEGRPPFRGDEPLAVLSAVVHEPAPLAPGAGPLGALIESLLSKDPADRPPLGAVASTLRSIADGMAGSEGTQELEPVRPDPEVTAPVPSVYDRAQPEIEEPAPARSPRRAWWFLAILGGLVGIGAAVAIWMPGSDEGAGTARPSPSPDERARAVPPGWTRYTDQSTGWRVAYPAGWQVRPNDESSVDFEDPASPTYLRVDWTDQPGPSPVGAWEEYSVEFAAQHDGYREIRLEPTRFKGFEAAEWEFAYREGGARLHALDLGFVTGDYGFALFFQSEASDWNASQDVFEAIQASFRAPD
jgi:eukaryotic-like serine/threonine-protein kinase